MKIQYAFLFFLFSGIIAFFACDDNSVKPDGQGSFRIEMYGDIYQSFTGKAYFGTVKDPETDEESFVVWMFTGGGAQPTENIWICRYGSTQPGTGSYLIGNYGDVSNLFVGIYVGSEVVIWSEEGTVSVNNSSEKRFSGGFGFSGVGFGYVDHDSAKNVTVEGTFDAVGGIVNPPGY